MGSISTHSERWRTKGAAKSERPIELKTMNPEEQTVTWLITLGVLNSPKKNIADPEEFLKTSLRDGIVLCKLMERVLPGAILKVIDHYICTCMFTWSSSRSLVNWNIFRNAEVSNTAMRNWRCTMRTAGLTLLALTSNTLRYIAFWKDTLHFETIFSK